MTHIITNMCGDVRGKVITWRRLFDTCLPISWQWKVAQAPKLAGRLHVPRVTLHTTYKVKRSPGHSGWLFKWLAGGGDIFWRPHNLFEHLLVSSWVYIRLNVKYFNIFFHILHHELKPVLVYLRTSLIRRSLAIIFSLKFFLSVKYEIFWEFLNDVSNFRALMAWWARYISVASWRGLTWIWGPLNKFLFPLLISDYVTAWVLLSL